MARRREVGILKLSILTAALAMGLALPAQAQNKLTLTGSATFTTDYMFRSISNTNQLPAVQPEFDLTYGIFWAYMGDPIPRLGRTSRSTTVGASRPSGGTSPSRLAGSNIPIRAPTTTSTISS